MSTDFPVSIDSFTTKVDGVDDVMAAHVNDLQDSVVQMQTWTKQQGPTRNLIRDTLFHDIWPLGTSFPDAADGTQITQHWYCLSTGNAPDVEGVLDSDYGFVTPWHRALHCTADGDVSVGFIHFIPHSDMVYFQARMLTLSVTFWSASLGVPFFKMGVMEWSGTPDAYTGPDVVDSWTSTPTLVSGWDWLDTSSIENQTALAGPTLGRQSYTIGFAPSPGADNLAVMIWANSLQNTQNFYIAGVQLEIGEGSSYFMPRSYEMESAEIFGTDASASEIVGANLLPDSLTHESSWQEGTTLNDLADDSYGPTLWTVLNNGASAPDITGEDGGATDPFSRYFRCTFDAANSRGGLVQFLENKDTIPLRGKLVSLSFDAWGTNVSNLRAMVIYWTSTADTLTSDVVSSWNTNPTLATNWAYITTPAASTGITGTRARYEINGLTVPTSANNIAVFIWTPDLEASGDLFNIAQVKLEVGAIATGFVARPVAQEANLMNRLYTKSFPITTAPTTNAGTDSSENYTALLAGASNNRGPNITWPVKMRTTPTVTLYNPSAANNSARDVSISADCGTTAVSLNGDRAMAVNAIGNASTSVGNRLSFHWVADARL